MDWLDEAIRKSPISGYGAKRPVIGVIGWGVPAELVAAHGATMFRSLPHFGQATPMADALVGTGESFETRALLEPVLKGELTACALLVVTRAHEWVYYFLKEAVRSGATPSGTIPPLHLFDFVPSSVPALRQYNLGQLQRLEEAIARELGQSADSSGWAQAISVGNDRRALFRRVAELREAGTLSGAESVRLGAASAGLHPGYFTTAASSWLDGLVPPEPKPGVLKPRVLLLANDDDHDGAIHAAVEAAGALVIAEDGEWGIRTAMADLPAGKPSSEALLDHLIDTATGPSVSPRERRLDWVLHQLRRDDIDAVVFAIPPSDQRFGWDYPFLRDQASAAGLPQFLLAIDARGQAEAATESVRAFLTTLNQEKAQ